jgi:uncharacterized protein Yka (UPF0111/DUF47 family)
MFSLQRLLFGREDQFFDLLEASAKEARSSVQALSRFLQNPERSKTLDEFILTRRKEKKIADEISEALCTVMVTSLEREDIEALSVALYRIPKTVEKIAERILLAPPLLKPVDIARQLEMLEKASDTLLGMIQELRRGAKLESIKKQNDHLQEIEGAADDLILAILRDLYSGQHNAIQVIFLKDLFELIEAVFDRCRDAGNIVKQIVLKNS